MQCGEIVAAWTPMLFGSHWHQTNFHSLGADSTSDAGAVLQCCCAATSSCRELWECWCGSLYMTFLRWPTPSLAVLELQWMHREDINCNQPQTYLHKVKSSECVTESPRVKCCHYLAAVSGGVLAAPPFLLLTTLSWFSAFLIDASFQSCFITFRGERIALLFVISYALQSCGKSPTWSERLLTLGHEILHFKEVGEIPSVAASWVPSVSCSQPNCLDKALPLPCCSFLPPFFFFPERRYSRSRSKAGGLSYSSHLVGSRQPSEMALTPLTEQEGEAYLEKCGSIRRHTVANAHSDIQLLAMASMMHTGMVIEESDSNDKCLLLQPSFSHRQCSSEPSIADGPEGGMATGRQDSAELNCTSVS